MTLDDGALDAINAGGIGIAVESVATSTAWNPVAGAYAGSSVALTRFGTTGTAVAGGGAGGAASNGGPATVTIMVGTSVPSNTLGTTHNGTVGTLSASLGARLTAGLRL